jgi:hypothetical protein
MNCVRNIGGANEKQGLITREKGVMPPLCINIAVKNQKRRSQAVESAQTIAQDIIA